MIGPGRRATQVLALAAPASGWAPGLPEVAGSAVGHPTPAAAMAALRSRPEVRFSDLHGWTIATDPPRTPYGPSPLRIIRQRRPS